MRHIHFQKSEYVPLFWELADAYVAGRYVISALLRGSVPFFDDLATAGAEADRLDYPMMEWITIAGALLMASIPISAGLLLARKSAGAVLSYCQAPFRVLMFLPSIALPAALFSVLKKIEFDVLGYPAYIAIALLLAFVLETVRVSSLVWWRRRGRAA